MDQSLGIEVNSTPGQRRKITKADIEESMRIGIVNLKKEVKGWFSRVANAGVFERGIEPPFTDRKIRANFFKVLREGDYSASQYVQKFLTTVMRDKEIKLEIYKFATPCGLQEIRYYNLYQINELPESKNMYEKFCRGELREPAKGKRAGKKRASRRMRRLGRGVVETGEKTKAPRSKKPSGGAHGVDGPPEGVRERFKTRVEKIRVKPIRF